MQPLIRIWKEVSSLFTALPNAFLEGISRIVDLGQTPHITDSAKRAERHLELATECMKQTKQMISGNNPTTVKLYHSQCTYLVENLETALIRASKLSYSPECKLRYHELLKFLYRLASEVQGFVQACCKDEWMQVAITSASVPTHVCSLGYHLKLCTVLLRNSSNSGAAALTPRELEKLRGAEKLAVKDRASVDEAKLLDTLKSLIPLGKSSSTDQSQLATVLHKRLEARQATSTLDLSKLWVWKIDGKTLCRLEKLGEGISAKVHKAKWFGAVEVAEKVFCLPSGSERELSVLAIEREVSALAKMSHPNIVSFLGYWTDEHSCAIVTELMDGDLYNLILEIPQHDGKGPFSISVACNIMLQVAEGVDHIHEQGFVHRDLKSENVLVKRSKGDDIDHICAKVADFGLSQTKEKSVACTHQTSNLGSFRNIAPELIGPLGEIQKTDGLHPRKSDAYSFGMLCFEILTGEMPFSYLSNPRAVKQEVLNGIRPVLPPHCPQELRRFIELCWDSDPTKRPYFSEICIKLRSLICSLLIERYDLPKWYLDSAREFMEHRMKHMQRMTSGNSFTRVKLYHNQCQYLADALGTAIKVSNLTIGPLHSTQTRTRLLALLLDTSSSSDHQAVAVYQLRILMLLYRLASEVEGFIQDCSKLEWMKTALASSRVPAPSVSVSSWGYHLKLCTVLLRNSVNPGAASPSREELESLRQAEELEVKRRVSVDELFLLETLNSLILPGKSSSADQFQLATVLRKRLEAGLAMPTLGSSDRILKIDLGAKNKKRQVLGSGSASTVYKSIWLGAEVAVKQFYGDHSFLQEVSILGKLSHPNLVNIFGYAQEDRGMTSSTLVMELMDEDLRSAIDGQLSKLQDRHGGSGDDEAPFNINEAVDLILQIAEGVRYLHEHGIVHRDLKSSNILVKHVKLNDTEFMSCKISDFGLSKGVMRAETYSNQTANVGTSRWMAPELISGRFADGSVASNYPFKVDTYSFGMLCSEILTGNIPFSQENLRPTEIRQMVLQDLRPMLPDWCPHDLRALIEACWQPDPRHRPSFPTICQELRYLKCKLLLPEHLGESQAQQVQQARQQAQSIPKSEHIVKVFDFSDLPVPKIEHSCLQRVIPIGKGGPETTVYKTIYKSEVGNVCVAQKRFVIIYDEDMKSEVTILANLKHSNVISLIGYAMDKRSCSIVMEMMEWNLHDLMCKRMWEQNTTPTMPFSIDEAVYVMLQIAEGMDYVHQRNVVHRDLKSFNILVRKTNGGQLEVKLADFGLSEKLKPGSNLRFNIGTFSWMAPEVMRLKKDEDMHRGTPVSLTFLYFSNAMGNIELMSGKRIKKYPPPFKSDIYSFGIVCCEILTGKTPTFHRKNRSGQNISNSVFKKEPHDKKAAFLLLFLFLEGLELEYPLEAVEGPKFKDPQQAAAVLLYLLEGLNFKKDPQKAMVALLLLHIKFRAKKDPSEVVKEKALAGFRPLLPDWCPPKLKALIESCWGANARARPSFAQIIVDLKDV